VGARTQEATTTTNRVVVGFQNRKGTNELPPCAKGFQLRKSPLFEKFHIVVLFLSVDDREAIYAALKCLGEDWERIPLRLSSSTVKIPTGEMFVKFKSDATAEQIQTQLQDLKLRVVELPARPNSAYKVTQTPTSAAHSLETVDSLKRLSTVEYAEPNWLIVRLEEP